MKKEILSVNQNLVEWFLENQCTGSENTRLDFQQHTFRDKDGVLRYMDSWLPAPEDGYPYLMPGCYELHLPQSAHSVSSERNGDAREKEVTVKVLLDWERMWCHLASELAMHDALLRASINFFMHKNTLYIFWILFVYDTIIISAFNVVTGGLSLGGILITLYYFISGIFYVILYRLYVGNNSPQPVDREDADTPAKQARRWASTRPHHKHWSGSLYHFVGLIVSEGRDLLFCQSYVKTQTTLKPMKRSVSSFDHLMAVALKYLTQHCEISSREINLSRRSYKMAFSGLFAGMVMFITVQFYVELTLVISFCNSQPQYCNLAIAQLILRGGFIIDSLQTFILIGSMSISIIGLSYGSELAYYMIGIWLKRFAVLRRVEYQSGSEGAASIEDGSVVSDAGIGSIAVYLQRDAVEQYLFIVEYLRQSGTVWSPVIVAMYCYGVFQIVLFLVFPSWSLASANAFLTPVLDVFTNSSRDDFNIIGGRDLWLDFVNSVPAAWTVYGVQITYARITGVLYAITATLFATYVLPVYMEYF
eukprot:gene29009-38053_t